MKAICDRAALTQWVQMAASVASARSPKPILGGIRIEATTDRMTLLATDLEVGIHITLDKMEVQEPGSAVVPADRLHQILRELGSDTVTLTGDDEELQIVAPGSRFKIVGDDPGDFPEVPPFKNEGAFEVLADDLKGLIQRTIFATAREHTRYALNGVLWEVEKTNLTMVATEGHRLSLARGKCKGGPESRQTAIVPTKAMQLVERCLGDMPDAQAAVRCAVTEREVHVASPVMDGGSWSVYSRLVDGHFPKYEDLIPKDYDRKVVLSAGDLLGAVRQAALLTNEESRGVRFRFAGGELVLSSRTPEMGEAEVRMTADYDGEPQEIGFNPVYLTDALKVVDAEEIQFAFKGPNKPGVITEGRLFTYLIMPVSVV